MAPDPPQRLGERPEGKVVQFSDSGFEIAREYTPAEAPLDYDEHVGSPGEFPYTRHIRHEGYRDRMWQPALYSGFGEPADANQRFKFLLGEGNGRVSIAFDLPTQLGLDSDHPRARYEVGRVGVAIDSLRDFEVMLDGIDLETVPVTMNMNALAPVVVAMLASVAEQQDVDLASLRGTISNDILHEISCRGLTRWGLRPSMCLLGETASFVLTNMPGFYAFNVRAALLHEVGANPVQELAFAMSIALRYLDELLERGYGIDEVAPRLSLFFATSPKLFEEAAKLRAARRLWARLLRDRYGATERESLRIRTTSVACNGSHFVREDPELNLVRSALGVLASALGGVQTMVGTAIDEAYEIPSDRAQELALRVQQIIGLESDVCATVDPLGGSYFIEAMTDQIERDARELMKKVEDDWGGVDRALEEERLQTVMRDRALTLQREIEEGRRPIVGVNVHRSTAAAPPLTLHESDPEVCERRVQDLNDLKSNRNSSDVETALKVLEEAARMEGSALMSAIRQAVDVYSTIGEIAQALSRGFGNDRLLESA